MKKGKPEGKPPRPWAMLPPLVAAMAVWLAVAFLGILEYPYPLAWAGAAVLAGVIAMEVLHSHRLSRLEAEAEEGLFVVMDDYNAREAESLEPQPAFPAGKMPRE